MRYVSFFSGIEMASLAFKPLGWEPVAFAEVDPFACAVLAHHYPNVPNLGDISKITAQQIADLGHIDLIIGGFPCQDVSNAGKRKGLRNDDGTTTRSGLFFDAMRHVRVAHRRCGLRWLILENVPGLYSSNAGRDFATVVGDIVGSTFDVPGEGWQDTGAAAGPRGMVEWCCLDSQWRSLAQRRERVFFVADFGDWANRSPVLLERESLQGNPPACVEARARPSSRTSRGPGRKGIWRQIAEAVWGGKEIGPTRVAPTLPARKLGGGGFGTEFEADGGLIPEVSKALAASQGQACANAEDLETYIPLAYGSDTTGPRDVALCLNAGGQGRIDFETETLITHIQPGGGFDEVTPLRASGAVGANGAGIGFPVDPMLTLDTDGSAAIAFSCKDDGRDATSDLAPTMRSMNFDKSHANAGGQLAIATRYEVRRLTPTECERLQGVPDGYTLIPYRGRMAADGPRYKALGNGFSVPVVRWIGERINDVATR